MFIHFVRKLMHRCSGILVGRRWLKSVEIQDHCQEFIANDLGLEFKPSSVQRTGAGVAFLGCRIWPTHVELNRRSKCRWRRRVRVLGWQRLHGEYRN